MAGSILEQDQVKKLNAAYPAIMSHLYELLANDQSPYGLMKIHFLTEHLDTTELYKIFSGLPFLSPAEKRALVRAAIYEVLLSREVKAIQPTLALSVVDSTTFATAADPTPTVVFSPPQFKLNVATVASLKEQVTPMPVSTTVPSALKVVDGLKAQSAAEAKEAQDLRDIAIAEVRAEGKDDAVR